MPVVAQVTAQVTAVAIQKPRAMDQGPRLANFRESTYLAMSSMSPLLSTAKQKARAMNTM